MSNSPEKQTQWHHPKDVMKFHKLKLKKRALQARINGNSSNANKAGSSEKRSALDAVFSSQKRKNPFVKDDADRKKFKVSDAVLDESTDQTLFKLLNQSSSINNDSSFTSFSNILERISANNEDETIEVVKATGKPWLPIDWTLKTKIRLISMKPFPWNQKLKISEEASGITGFTRCLDNENTETNLDASANAKFHQCCLYWQQPYLPWLTLFPRQSGKSFNKVPNLASSNAAKNSLYQSWIDSFRSLFQLIRTRQCPYFYVCANSFTVLFRAAGICGYADIHAFITPSTRGLRHLLKQEDIEFTMPLKNTHNIDQGYETLDSESGQSQEVLEEEEGFNENWLKNMGISSEDIKQINYTQARIVHKTECQVDNSDQSLVVIEGVEVNSFFNFLINCKSTIAVTGALAGVPPTLLAPVAFHGATLNSLKVRENKIQSDGSDFYCLELIGPILPSAVHNLFAINDSDHSMTATFNNLRNTEAFSKVVNEKRRKSDIENTGTTIFNKENLSDCGLNSKILKHFCAADSDVVSIVECLKYCGENASFTWT